MPRATIRVPATSANLGPGFDTLGLALGLWNEVRLEPADAWSVEHVGEGAGAVPRGEENLVLRAVRAVECRAGAAAPPHRLHCTQRVPVSRGLGSSAAAAVAGAAAGALALGRPLDPQEALAVAAGLDGHPDNAAACALGGLTAAMVGTDGAPVARRLACGFAGPVIALVPALELETRAMRAALPANVPHGDAVWNLQRQALLLAAFAEGDLELLASSMQDRLHEPYRSPHIPGFEAVRAAALGAGAVGLCLSGAGPTLLCFPRSGEAAPALGRALEAAWAGEGVAARALVLPLAQGGVEVE